MTLNPYLRIARPDHWIKNLFVLPGCCFAAFLLEPRVLFSAGAMARIALALAATCCVSSANYALNEWLDRDFDRFHPTKRQRPAVQGALSPARVYGLYAALALAGLATALVVSPLVGLGLGALLLMGIVYNVPPLRSKDVPYLDVLSESLNNALRFLVGWFAVTSAFLPPVSLVFGYWMGGAFLMAVKRFAEYRMIGDPSLAGRYRKSFLGYSELSLLVSAVFYALNSIFFVCIFIVKYKIEFLLLVPLISGLFCQYLALGYKEDSAAQKPEKLFHEKALMLSVAGINIIAVALLFIDLPFLNVFLDTILIRVQG